MTITLTPQTEARLRERAVRDGQDMNAVADMLINTALEWEIQDHEELMAGVERGDQAISEGRERRLTEFLAAQRIKHGFSSQWPHMDSGNGQNER